MCVVGVGVGGVGGWVGGWCDSRGREGLNLHAESLKSSAGDQGDCSVGHLSIGKITAVRVDNVIGEMQLHAHVF